jgi:DNA-binding protein HU-beta
MNFIGKKHLVYLYTKKYGVSIRDAERALSRTFELIRELVADLESVRITGVGTLYVTRRRSRKQINNLTGEKITVPEKFYVKFRPLRGLATKLAEEHSRKRKRRKKKKKR